MRFFTTLLLILGTLSLSAQPPRKAYTAKKGEAIDILLITTSNNGIADSIQKIYYQTAFPVAGKFNYNGQGGNAIGKPHLRGNYQPDIFVVGTWPSIEKRAEALVALKKDVKDFDLMRRQIWSSFNATYWEAKEDISFTIEKEVYNVMTALWANDGKSLETYGQKWAKNIQKAGGNILLQLSDGMSPFGYHYAPDLVVLTAWPSEKVYQNFMAGTKKVDTELVRQIDEFQVK